MKTIRTVKDIKEELKKLDIIYYKNEISLKDYESAKQDLYIFQYKLEKQE